MSEALPRPVDVIIALGHPVEEDGVPSPIMRSRVDKAVQLLKQGFAKRLLLQGGAVKNEFVEAEVMAEYARSKGVEREQLVTETYSQDTVDNVEAAIAIMKERGWQTAIVVTSPYHTRRVKRLFSDYDFAVDVVASDFPTDWPIWCRLRAIVHECALLLWYQVKGIN